MTAEPEPPRRRRRPPTAAVAVALLAVAALAVFYVGFLAAPLAILVLFSFGFSAVDRSLSSTRRPAPDRGGEERERRAA